MANSIEFSVGPATITNYKRLSYTPWHAIAEFVDNSTQAYFNNRKRLDAMYRKEGVPGLRVSIVYERDAKNGFLRVSDNSVGMSFEELGNAMKVAMPPANPTGRSKYGMGLKTAACWIGNKWTVRTKKLGETVEHRVTIDVNKIAAGDVLIYEPPKKGRSPEEHYTIIEISHHNQRFHGRTLGKIREYLSSMYRQDFRNGFLTLEWQGEALSWSEPELLKSRDGSLWRRDFEFTVDGKKIHGWAGILKRGSRSAAGFAMVQSDRVIRSWPDAAWKPANIYGQPGGSNTLVSQRVTGEIHLDGFDVSHTKDDILWRESQEEDVEKALFRKIKELVEFARNVRFKTLDGDERGPSEAEIDVAIESVKEELESPEMVDQVHLTDIPDREVLEMLKDKLVEDVTGNQEADIRAKVGNLTVRVYLAADLSLSDPYVLVESTKDSEVLVIINRQHPHWLQLRASEGVSNYVKHCIYDAIAEWQAMKLTARIDPDTIKVLKDRLLRVAFEMERHEATEYTA